MWVELTVYGSFLVGSYIYHRWFAEQPPKPTPAQRIEIPRIDQGASIPLLYGKCRVRSPILAWAGTPTATDQGVAGLFHYSMDMFMLLGIPFSNAAVKVWRVWIGERELAGGQAKVHSYDGSGAHTSWIVANKTNDEDLQHGVVGSFVEIYDGRAAQTIDGVALARMQAAGADPPGFRGYASVFHFGSGSTKWGIGFSPNLGAYQYEVSSYPADSDAFNVGDEANPSKVIYDLLTGKFGKLNVPASRIDGASFASAKVRLQEEGNGYSRSIEDAPDANQIFQEILRQIDGVLYEDPADGLIKLKLIRGDYDWSTLIGITTENCERLENFAAGSFENVVNKVRVIFTNRADGYHDGSAAAHNQAVAAGQDGDVREALIHMPGVCTQQLANEIAARELAARSRPIAKCRAIVDRTFHKVRPGDPIRVTWPEYGIDGRVFRVANVGFGTLENGKIALDLIEDFFYVWRNVVIPTHPIEPFPGVEVAEGA